jgi:hypothetical protein
MQKSILITLCIATMVLSAEESNHPPHKKGGQPPKEAISACSNKSSGESCNITTPRGDTLSGTCENTPDGKYFACKPADEGGDKKPR